MKKLTQIELMATRLKELRNANGLTQKDMAEALGYLLETYQNYEKGKSRIPYEVLLALRKDFNVDLNLFICGDEVVHTEPVPEEQLRDTPEQLNDIQEKITLILDLLKPGKN